RIPRDALLVFTIVRERMRARAYQRHLAGDHVEELRQLVDIPAAKPAPCPGHAGILFRCLVYLPPVFERAHGAEFENAEQPLVKAVSVLQEEHGASAVQLNEERCYEQERREQQQRYGSKGQIEG